MPSFLSRKIDVETYLISSTIISVFLLIRVARIGVDIFAGYPVIILNTLLMLALGRLIIHRNHAIIISTIALVSLLASRFSPTPVTAVIAQILGISLMSIYYFSALVTSGPTVPRWLELYARAAFYIAVYGIFDYILRHTMLYDRTAEQRLRSVFAEPSLFIYTTLPAIGFYINTWHSERRYGWEALIFLMAYILADSALGFLGLLLIAIFTYTRRFTVWHVLGAGAAALMLVTALYFVSQNFRLRISDTAIAVSSQSLKNSNASTFAFLSNAYVATSAMIDHPILGVGIGGFGNIYDTYISELGKEELRDANVGLNKEDANSLFMRVAAELGPAGLIALVGFLAICARVEGQPHRGIRNSLLPYMVVRMSRFGAYFSMELYFFVGLYLLNYLDYRRKFIFSLLENAEKHP